MLYSRIDLPQEQNGCIDASHQRHSRQRCVGNTLWNHHQAYREARQRFAAQQAGTKAWPLQKWQETSELDHPVWKNGGQFLGSSM